MKEIQFREGKVKFSSETETSECDSEQPETPLMPTHYQPPEILQHPKDFRLIEGSDATFVCKVTGRPRPKVILHDHSIIIPKSGIHQFVIPFSCFDLM